MKTILFIIASTLCVFMSLAQCVPTSNLNISTGYDPVTNNILTVGNIDPLWRTVTLPPLSSGNWSQPAYASAAIGTSYIIGPAYTPGWCDNNLGDSMPLSPITGPGFSSDNAFADQPMRFVREFCVIDKPELVNIDLSIKADDCARIVLYDSFNNPIFGYTTRGILGATPLQNNWQCSNTSNFNDNQFNGWNHTANYNLVPGSYTIEVELRNTSSGSLGFVVSGAITTISGDASLSNDDGCCDIGTIYGQKILDQDCNGEFSAGDLRGPGVTIQLLDASLNPITTTATDANGEFFFRNVPYGNYRVVELLNDPNYIPQSSAIRNVTVGRGSQSHYVTFYNCPAVDDFEAPDDCCVTKLDIWNASGTPSPLVPLQATMATGEQVSLAQETFEIHRDALIPINELRVVVTDIQFEYDIEACAQCVENPSLWGSIYGNPQIGTATDALTKQTQGFFGDFVDDFNERRNQREIIWENPDGAMLKAGDTFDVMYTLPPASQIPCCAIGARICTEISWKDANCNLCTINTCSNIDMVSAQEQLEAMTITVEKEGCCSRRLTASASGGTYLWNNGETSQSIVVEDNGIYDVTTTLTGATAKSSVAITDILSGAFPTLSYLPEIAPDQGINLKISDYTKALNASHSYNATKYTLWIVNRWGSNGANGAFRKIEKEATCGDGFLNGEIQWDGRDNAGNKVPQGVYEFVLRLENCTNKCASEGGTCNETHNYEQWDPCLYKERTWQFPVPWPIMKCVAGWGIKSERVGNVTLLW